MWLPNLPSADEELRQGDLVTSIPFPKAGTVELTGEGLHGAVDDGVSAVVLDHCCTVEQHHVLILARVKSQAVSERMLTALQNVDPTVPGPYARYAHLLEPHDALQPIKKGKVKVVNLLDRVQLIGTSSDAFAWLREARAARMTVVARAHLRQKLAVHFGRAEEGDLEILQQEGLDDFGRPAPRVLRGFPD